MARASRVPQSQPLYDDSDSNAGTEQDTPKRKPRRSELRKRLSEAYHPDHDSLMSESGGQAGQKSVEINDDAAEKRRRRKSTRMAAPQPAPTSEAVDGQDQGDSSRTVKQKLQLPAIPPPVFNKEDMAVTYERWMKIATDNKISAQNTWELMLIDYFHDMSLLRNEDDNSINFQRASCTLDGCIKIWTSRVDSVGTETAKLASNLASGGVGDDDGVDDDGSDDPDGDRVERKKKKSHRTVATLVRDPAQLKAKKLDLEFSVDPLFRKTCADFDEGGAQGLLMNHLSLGVGQDGNLRVVFDASDSMIRPEGEEEEEEREDLIDLTYLRDTFMPNLSDLESKAICHSLDEFSFTSNNLSQDETTFFQDNTPHDDDDDDDDFGANFDVSGTDNAQDFFTGNDAVNDDFVGDMGGDDFGGDDSNGNMDIPPGEGTGPYVPFDPRHAPKANDLVLAMTGDADGEGGMMDYFDKTFLKNWAGPEHWKMRRAVRPDADATATKEPKRREKKEAFRIDFLEPRTEEASKALAEKLFAKPGKGASINLPGTTANGARTRKKTKEKEKKSDHKLPDDMHFSSHQLISLFLKPKFTLQSRGSGNNTGSRAQHNDELDVDFWAQTADQAAQRNNDGDETAGPIPFNTQFFHDDYDDGPGFDDVDDGFGGAIDPGEQDLLGPSQGMPRRAKPEAVKYSKRAKRVDVRKLKDNIWKGLDIVVPKNKEEEENEMDVDEDVEPTEPSESRQFDSVISNLQTVYPSDKMAEISTSFCFICLLHLANEQGLKLENPTTPNDRSAHDERKVGNIWDLKVYRDPEASAV